MDTLRRRTIRLPDYDYSQDGAYFITLCAHKRECLFGEVAGDGTLQLNTCGQIVHEEWLQTAVVRPYVVLDEYVVMPNHFHAILFLANEHNTPVSAQNHPDMLNVGARRAVPLHPKHRKFGEPVAGSLPTIIGAFKSAATKRINEHRHTLGAQV